MKPWEIIAEIRSDNSKLFKQEIVLQFKDNTEFLEGLQYGLTPLTTYGTKDVGVKCAMVAGWHSEGLSWGNFKFLLEKLKNRELTGHAARDAINLAMEKSGIDQWNNWYRCILLKDFKAGFSERTVNKMIPDTISVWGCMLASDGLKSQKTMDNLKEAIVEFKYDGIRCIAIVQNNECVLYSRNGKVLPNFPHIEKVLSKPEFNNLVFDGEIMSENFQELMKQVYRKSDVKTSDAYLALFDMLPLDEYNAGKSTEGQLQRKLNMRKLARFPWSDVVNTTRWDIVNFATEEGQAEFNRLNKQALKAGFEGLMIKPLNDIYVCKRSKSWLKIKPIIEVTLTVIDVEEGQGKFEGTTGALVCEGEDDGLLIKVNVGSGLTDENRKEIWTDSANVIGSLVEIRADVVTQNQDGSYSLRFPRFKTFRGFNPGEKL